MIKIQTNLSNISGSLKDIQAIAVSHNLPIQYTINKVQEGWMHKPKGMLQILWERGFIDPEKGVSDYAINGKKIRKGDDDIIPGSNLKNLIDNLPDFKEELTLLQYQAKQLDVEVRCSPKYHPKIAGEAIEFCWAKSKNTYRRCRIEDKRTKTKFLSLVDECQKVVTKQAVRFFGRRLRRYILAYHSIELAKQQQVCNNTTMIDNNMRIVNIPDMSCHLIERLVRKQKSHRNIADSEKKFINTISKMMDETSSNLT